MIIGWLAWSVVKEFPRKVELEQQLGDMKSRFESLKKEEERTNEMLDYLRSESYLEKQARLRLNLKKEGEGVVFVYRKEENQNQSGQDQPSQEQEEKSFLSIIKEWFKILIPKRD